MAAIFTLTGICEKKEISWLEWLEWLEITGRVQEMVLPATSVNLRSLFVALGRRGRQRGRLHASLPIL